MFSSSNENSSVEEFKFRLPRVQLLDRVLEYRLFQYNLQSYLSTLPKLTSITVLNPNISQNSESTEKHQKDHSALYIDLSNLHNTKQFELRINSKFPNPLCKCKYFSLKVYLKPLQQFVFPIHEKVELEVFVFTEDGERITKNMKGNDILRGNFVQNLSHFALEAVHIAYFRIQLTEVSSHFVGKTVTIKIKARQSEFMRKMGWKIKSLCVMDVAIKAKESTNKC